MTENKPETSTIADSETSKPALLPLPQTVTGAPTNIVRLVVETLVAAGLARRHIAYAHGITTTGVTQMCQRGRQTRLSTLHGLAKSVRKLGYALDIDARVRATEQVVVTCVISKIPVAAAPTPSLHG
jgi:hypothetical protein